MKCLLCRSSQINELLLGPTHTRQGILVHQNCLYLSSNLVQRGDEKKDICCFTLKDIEAESRRTQNLYCHYCKRPGANIGCCKEKCRRTFHTYCGIQNGAQNQFFGTYKSFCNLHIASYKKRPPPQAECAICMVQLIGVNESFSFTKYIHGKCCNNGWYHRDCLQRYAVSAGYFFKCPLCNDNKTFRLVMLWGISVPNRDASWEQTDAFADQLQVPLNCTAVKCLNAKGRKSTKNELLYCTLCGGNPMHPECTTSTADDYSCIDCEPVQKMPASYLQEEEDPIDVYIANQQAMRKLNAKNTAAPPAPRPPADLSSDSEDDIDIIIAIIQRKRREAATTRGIRAASRSGHVTTPLSTVAPSNRMHKESSPSHVAQRRRSRSRSRGANSAGNMNEKQVENPEKVLLPTSVAPLRIRTRSSSRRTNIAAELKEIQLDTDKENHENPQLTPKAEASSRRARSSYRLSNIAARMEQMQVNDHKEPPTAAASRRGRSRSRRRAAGLDEKEDSDKENLKKEQLTPKAAASSRRARSNIAARMEQMQVNDHKEPPTAAASRRGRSRSRRSAAGLDEKEDSDKENLKEQLTPKAAASSRRARSDIAANIGARMEQMQVNDHKEPPTAAASRRGRSRSRWRAAGLDEKEDSDKENLKKEQLTPKAAASSRRARSNIPANIGARMEQMQVNDHKEPPTAAASRRGRSRSRWRATGLDEKEDSDGENLKKEQLTPAAAAANRRGRSRSRRATLAAGPEVKAAIVTRRQTCVSPRMLQKDSRPLISRGRSRKRSCACQQTHNMAIDISCIAKRTRARSCNKN